MGEASITHGVVGTCSTHGKGNLLKQDLEEQLEIIRRGTVEVLGEAELRKKLATGKPLRVKAGFDPTAADLHLGHTVLLQKLRQFQKLGHTVVFLIGDFTATIGDPSGRSGTRPVLGRDEIEENARTYQDQVFRILDRDGVEVRWNSEWMDRQSAADLVRLAGEHTVARMLERDDFQKRYASEQPIGIHEFLYPLVQGYDSVALKADVELGGTDQKFNLLMGRELQRNRSMAPQAVVTMPLLEGTDGVHKMSKSLGNAIGVTDPSEQMYGALMSISDTLMLRYYELLSDAEADEVERVSSGAVHPMDAKKRLAAEIVERFHGADAASAAQADFETRFQKRGIPEDLPELVLPAGEPVAISRVLRDANLVSSNGDARRTIAQGAVKVDGEPVGELNFELSGVGDCIVQVGKRRIVRVRFEA